MPFSIDSLKKHYAERKKKKACFFLLQFSIRTMNWLIADTHIHTLCHIIVNTQIQQKKARPSDWLLFRFCLFVCCQRAFTVNWVWGWLKSTSRIPLRFSTCFDSVSTVSPLSLILRNFFSCFCLFLFDFVCFRGDDLFCHFIFVFFFTIVDGGMGWGQCCQWPKRHLAFSIFERDVSCVLRWWENVAALKADLFLSILFYFLFSFSFCFFDSFFSVFYDVLLSLIFSLHWPMWVCQNGLHRLSTSWLIPFSAVALKLSSFSLCFPVWLFGWLGLTLFCSLAFRFYICFNLFFFLLFRRHYAREHDYKPVPHSTEYVWRNRYCMMEWMWRQLCCHLFFPAFFICRSVIFWYFFFFAFFHCFFLLLQRMFLNLLFVLSHSVLFLSLMRESSCYNLLFPSILMLPFIRRSLFTLINFYFFPYHCVS